MWNESGNGGEDYRQSAETVGFTSMGRWESWKVGVFEGADGCEIWERRNGGNAVWSFLWFGWSIKLYRGMSVEEDVMKVNGLHDRTQFPNPPYSHTPRYPKTPHHRSSALCLTNSIPYPTALTTNLTPPNCV